MEMEQSLKEDIGTLEVLFRLLKAEIYLKHRAENELVRVAEEFEEPVITIGYRASSYLKITEKETVEKSSENKRTNARILEISMDLLKEPIEIVCTNLLLAMILLEEARCIELQDIENKVRKDKSPTVRLYTSRNGYYKKKAYQDKCKQLGIECEKDSKRGYANEMPTRELIEKLKELNVMNYKFVCRLIKKPKMEQRFIVYQCPKCGIKVRGTKSGLHLICNDVEEHDNNKPAIMTEGIKN